VTLHLRYVGTWNASPSGPLIARQVSRGLQHDARPGGEDGHIGRAGSRVASPRASVGHACQRIVRRSRRQRARTTAAHSTTQFRPASMVVSYVSRDTNRLDSRDMEGTSAQVA
jgi:hypothetical protein